VYPCQVEIDTKTTVLEITTYTQRMKFMTKMDCIKIRTKSLHLHEDKDKHKTKNKTIVLAYKGRHTPRGLSIM